MASCTMVSSRWVAGLSMGMRAFSASATIMSAMSASPSETRKLAWAAAEQPGCVLRQHSLLADQTQQVAVGLQDWRSLAPQQARLKLARIAQQQRRQDERKHHLRALSDEIEDQDHTSIISMRKNRRMTSRANTRLRYLRMVRNCRWLRWSAANQMAPPTGA